MVLISILVAACGAKPPSELPTPQVKITQAPPVEQQAADYLSTWQKDYVTLYGMLSSASRSQISQEEFLAAYEEANNNLSLISMTGAVKNIITDPASAQVNFAVTYTTALFGDLQQDAVVTDWKMAAGKCAGIRVPFWQNSQWQ